MGFRATPMRSVENVSEPIASASSERGRARRATPVAASTSITYVNACRPHAARCAANTVTVDIGPKRSSENARH